MSIRRPTTLGRMLAALGAVVMTWTLTAVGSAAVPAVHITPVVASVIASPQPVPATDGHTHLAYELQLVNVSSSQATVKGIEVLAGRAVLTKLAGPHLLATMIRPGEKPGNVIGAGRVAVVLVDVGLKAGMKPPRALVHRITIELHPSDPGAASTYDAAPTAVRQREAIVIDSPLRGAGWLVGNGCCDAATAHRAAILPIDGALRAPERFAIDFVRLTADNHLFSGPLDRFSSYPFYGAPVYSVSAGTVTSVVNNLLDTTPGSFPEGITAQDAGGNSVVVQMGQRRWAFYAHFQPGSVRVRVGQHVAAGQVLGLLGNSGNSDTPHLHFHIMDGPSPLGSNGLPFRLAHFTGQGVLMNLADFMDGKRGVIRRQWLGAHADQLPLNDQVIAFG